ncbi:MAG: hypothetical protein V7651_17095 [Hyphomonas oceanitis]|uniref:hypothetical protein n=1 Tax=Hyphomonas oceanitis TaxID=81033 RepID=UPI00300127B0
MIHRLALSVLLLTISACTSIEFAPSSQLTGSKRVTEKSYTLGEPIETFVGATMIRVRDYKRDTYSGTEVKIMKPFTVSGFAFNRSFALGDTYPYGGKTKLNKQDMDFFMVNGQYGLLYDAEGEVQSKILNINPSAQVFMVYTYENDGGTGAVERADVERVTNTPDGQNFEIIYSGLDGDSIRLNYREYSDGDLAREAFFQQLTYPRSSKVIRFRNIELEVQSVEADKIIFSVVSE